MRCTAPHLESLLIDDGDWIMAVKQTSHFSNSRHSTISKCWSHPDRDTSSSIPSNFCKICESVSNWTRVNWNGWNRRETIVIFVIRIGWKLLTIDYVLLLLVLWPHRAAIIGKETNVVLLLCKTTSWKSFKMNTLCPWGGRNFLLLFCCWFIVRVWVHSSVLLEPYFNERANVYIRWIFIGISLVSSRLVSRVGHLVSVRVCVYVVHKCHFHSLYHTCSQHKQVFELMGLRMPHFPYVRPFIFRCCHKSFFNEYTIHFAFVNLGTTRKKHQQQDKTKQQNGNGKRRQGAHNMQYNEQICIRWKDMCCVWMGLTLIP